MVLLKLVESPYHYRNNSSTRTSLVVLTARLRAEIPQNIS